jgi:hypothetical protein
MSLEKPFYRCYRPNIKNENVEYLRDRRNVENPYDYVNKLDILDDRLKKIFEFIEPCETNISTYSVQISSLLLDVCTTIEANFRAILKKNGYEKDIAQCNMCDYFLIEESHHLSSYEIKIPFWKDDKQEERFVWEEGGKVRRPFEKWHNKTYDSLDWYQSYNQVKHNMIENFDKATLDNLVDAFCGLHILMCSQFYDIQVINPPDLNQFTLLGDCPSFDDYPYISTIRGNFLIKIPRNNEWEKDDMYSFDWDQLKNEKEPYKKYPYKKLIKNKNYCKNCKVMK